MKIIKLLAFIMIICLVSCRKDDYTPVVHKGIKGPSPAPDRLPNYNGVTWAGKLK